MEVIRDEASTNFSKTSRDGVQEIVYFISALPGYLFRRVNVVVFHWGFYFNIQRMCNVSKVTQEASKLR